MSRVHDALRRAETGRPVSTPVVPPAGPLGAVAAMTTAHVATPGVADSGPLTGLLEQIQEVPWDPAPEAHLIDSQRLQESPTEEFRSLRTRINHLQSVQRLHTLVVTSASPAEGKSFTAANLAVVESHLQGNNTVLCDFDFRRPIIHSLFRIDRSPGLTDYLQGKATLPEIIRKIAGTNLFLIPAGGAVLNPLELLNLKEVKTLLDRLPSLFNWVVLDSPPLLFAADANLLSTMCDGTLLVVRLGQTNIDAVSRALTGMSHNNVIGVVANAAKRGELYSKYTYYHSYYYEKAETDDAEDNEDGSPASESEKNG
ncbi:MAG: CpsD/CapB family tyrosine-protein kinase [Bryobacterales bacterium]|nr:CpsD/CapB family tyrosine-protein kinase [Bryobacterales bacterium]